jgi:hypothetical protein
MGSPKIQELFQEVGFSVTSVESLVAHVLAAASELGEEARDAISQGILDWTQEEKALALFRASVNLGEKLEKDIATL